MMNKYKYMKTVAGCCVALAALASCSDEWDSHYEASGGIPAVSLMDLLRQDARLEKFCQIIEKTQADTLLSSTQTYTVWAPENDALANVDMDDMEALQRLVRNHIARYSYPTSTSPREKIYMLNNKIMSYEDGNQFMEVPIEEKNVLAQNGVLHVMGGQIPYQFNVLERMATDPNYSKVYEFITRWSERKYDAGLSTPYDSVFVDYNPILESGSGIGLLDEEDSLYTMIIPDNAAWDAAMERLKPYFRPGSELTGEALAAYQDSVSESKAGQAILSGLTFPGAKFEDAQGNFIEPATWDSLYTIDRHLLYKANLQTYFSGYELEKASNGYMYLAHGNLNWADTCTWNPVIEIEGENDYYATADKAAVATTRNVNTFSAVRGVSGNAYKELTASNNNAGITYKIPQVLSGKYAIWVDYVPPIVDGLSKTSRVQYQLVYLDEEGNVPLRGASKTFKENSYTIQNANVYEEDEDEGDSSGESIGGEEEEPDSPMVKEGVVSQKVGEVEFPSVDHYDNMWYYDERNANMTTSINTTLKVLFNLTSTESKDRAWERVARIDRIRLVPIME